MKLQIQRNNLLTKITSYKFKFLNLLEFQNTQTLIQLSLIYALNFLMKWEAASTKILIYSSLAAMIALYARKPNKKKS